MVQHGKDSFELTDEEKETFSLQYVDFHRSRSAVNHSLYKLSEVPLDKQIQLPKYERGRPQNQWLFLACQVFLKERIPKKDVAVRRGVQIKPQKGEQIQT